MSKQSKLMSELFDVPEISHLDGIPWHEAKRPFPLHECKPQTTGFIGLSLVQRCACGAIQNGVDGYWLRKNDRWGKTLPVLTGAIGGVLALIGLIAVFLFF